MRPNGFPDNHYHGGKGTESVCHFCCNPTSSDGMFCNRHMLDFTDTAKVATSDGTTSFGLEFANGYGTGSKYGVSGDGHLQWMKYDAENGNSAGKVEKNLRVLRDINSIIQTQEMHLLTLATLALMILT